MHEYMLDCSVYASNVLPGRSLNSSKFAFDEINRQAGYHLIHPPTAFPQQPPEPWNQPALVARKRPLSGSEALIPSFPAIQPKPPGLNSSAFPPLSTESGPPARPTSGDLAGEPVRKRRGRPSNAQIEHEKATAAAEGREWQPRPSRAPRKKRSKTSGDINPEGNQSESTHPSFPATPEVHTGKIDDEMLGVGQQNHKTHEEPMVVRTTPYDPIRQSPSQLATGPTDSLPTLPGHRSHPLDPASLPATPKMHAGYERQMTYPRPHNDRGQEMSID